MVSEVSGRVRCESIHCLIAVVRPSLPRRVRAATQPLGAHSAGKPIDQINRSAPLHTAPQPTHLPRLARYGRHHVGRRDQPRDGARGQRRRPQQGEGARLEGLAFRGRERVPRGEGGGEELQGGLSDGGGFLPGQALRSDTFGGRVAWAVVFVA